MTIVRMLRLLLFCVLACGGLEGLPALEPALELRGKWVLGPAGEPIPPGEFRRGLQPSGLAWRRAAGGGELWAIGDQRSEYPGHIFRIVPETGRLAAPPLRLEPPAPADGGQSPAFEAYRRIPNSDFEGLAFHPAEPDILFAVTEDKVPWVATIRLESEAAAGAPRARILALAEILFPEGLESWRGDPNFRLEGVAVSDGGEELYLAFERAQDELPRIYRAAVESARRGKDLELELVPVRFGDLPPRASKPRALLNLNDIQFIRLGSAPCLLAIARDQERLLLIDLEAGAVRRFLDLDLLGPEGERIFWVSPEGLAFDRESDRLWIINDPDSVRGNYRRLEEENAGGRFAEFAPLLFEMSLKRALGGEEPAGVEGR
jgi:hypothetical protein